MSSVVVLGAHTAIGRILVESLSERLSDVHVVAATTTEHIGPDLDLIDHKLLESADIAILAFSGDFAAKLADGLKAMSKHLIDVASAVNDAPLVFPQLVQVVGSQSAIHVLQEKKIVRTPLGMVGPIVSTLKSLTPVGVRSAHIVTMESASGLGRPGIDELSEQIRAMFAMNEPQTDCFYSPLAFNILPSLGEAEDPFVFDDEFTRDISSGLSYESDIQAVRVRVPTVSVEMAVLRIDLEDEVELELIEQIFDKAPGLRRVKLSAPGILTAVDREDTLVFRIRLVGSKLQVCLAADRLRSGGATHAALLVESFITRRT